MSTMSVLVHLKIEVRPNTSTVQESHHSGNHITVYTATLT